MRDIRKVHGGANAPPQAESADVRHMQDEAQAALSAQGTGRALAGKRIERLRHAAQAAQDGTDAPRAKNAWCSLRVNGGADAPQVRNEDA